MRVETLNYESKRAVFAAVFVAIHSLLQRVGLSCSLLCRANIRNMFPVLFSLLTYLPHGTE